MNPDGMSYLDMASEAVRSGPGSLVNGYWSPLYPALIGCALLLIRPAPAFLFPAVHLVNLVIFAVTLLCFTFFVRSWSAIEKLKSAASQSQKPYLIPFSFGLFFWFAEEFTRPSLEHPDLCVTAIVFLIAALCCRINAASQWRDYLALGFAFGLGYYAKAVMFPLALILLAILFVLPPPGEKARLKVVSSAPAFLFLATPLVVLVSKRVGHLSTGEVGAVAYGAYVNAIPGPPSWAGGVNGTPKHVPRTIFREPVILEFSSPLKGTNPLGYDPSYWFAGFRPYFNVRQQLAAIRVNLRFYFGFFLDMIAIVSGALILYLVSPRGSLSRRPGNLFWWLILWPLATCGIYALVHVEARFIPAFLVVFLAGAL